MLITSNWISTLSGGLAALCIALVFGLFVWCMAIALDRRHLVKKVAHETDVFLHQFERTPNLRALFNAKQGKYSQENGVSKIFESAMVLQNQLDLAGSTDKEIALFTAQKSLSSAIHTEVAHLEHGVSVLGTIAAITPYVGLLGTVAGVTQALSAAHVGGAGNIDALIPLIGEALLATAIGLFVAILATYLFNDLEERISNLAAHFESFADRFLIRRAVDFARRNNAHA
jgi:biopolymer transport protein TolQ